jgi:hypothetical protein
MQLDKGKAVVEVGQLLLKLGLEILRTGCGWGQKG